MLQTPSENDPDVNKTPEKNNSMIVPLHTPPSRDTENDKQEDALIESDRDFINQPSPSQSPIDEKFLVLLLFCYCICPVTFYYIRQAAAQTTFKSTLQLGDIYIIECLAVFLGVGGYQLYFWVQRNSFLNREPYNVPRLPWIDHWDFSPNWIYFYSLFYYCWCASLVMCFRDYQDFVRITCGGLILLICLAICFYMFPTSGSHGERPTSHGVWLLDITQKMDKPRNGCPSGHMAFATYVWLNLFPLFGWWGFIAVAITAASCLKLKQHTFLDLVCGTLFSPLVYFGGVKYLIGN